MPELGEIVKAKDIQKRDDYHYIWHACVDCGKRRWVVFTKGKVRNIRCNTCNPKLIARIRDNSYFKRGIGNSNWKGGRFEVGKGYIAVWLNELSPYFGMALKNGYILEHRLVMAQHLGRCLARKEHVHHKNGIKTDNRIENLQLVSQVDHHTFTMICSQCELRREIRLLHWQIKEQSEQIRLLTAKLMGFESEGTTIVYHDKR